MADDSNSAAAFQVGRIFTSLSHFDIDLDHRLRSEWQARTPRPVIGNRLSNKPVGMGSGKLLPKSCQLREGTQDVICQEG